MSDDRRLPPDPHGGPDRREYAAQDTSSEAYDRDEVRHDAHGGFKWGAAFFGWLVAVALTILLVGIVGAVLAAVGSSMNISQASAEAKAGTIGIASGVVLLVVLMIAYFAGGYVAGRMARFDGARQGLGVWILGIVVTILVAVIGGVFGSQYNIFERVNLPSIPVPADALTWGGVIAAVIILLGTLAAAIGGGKAGQRYHSKIDRTPV